MGPNAFTKLDELHGRLKKMGLNLDNLMESSRAASKGYKNNIGKRCTMGHTMQTNDHKK